MSTLRPCQNCGGLYVPESHLVRCCPACLLTLALGAGGQAGQAAPSPAPWNAMPVADEPVAARRPSAEVPVVRTPPRRLALAWAALALVALVSLAAALVVSAVRATQEAAADRALADAAAGRAIASASVAEEAARKAAKEAASAMAMAAEASREAERRRSAAGDVRIEGYRRTTGAGQPAGSPSTPVALDQAARGGGGPPASSAPTTRRADPPVPVGTDRPGAPPPAVTPAGSSIPPPMRIAAPLTVKLATTAPAGSAQAVNVKDLADRWAVLSGGSVKLLVYAGGIRGDDRSVIMDMKLGSLGAAVLGAEGLAELDPAFNALRMPMAYDSDEEAGAVLAGMRSRLEASLEAKGFVVLSWADAGRERFFSTRPVATPDDLRKLKLFHRPGDPTSLEIWEATGFSLRLGALADLPGGLSTGLFEACSMSPQVAMVGRYYERAKYMTDLDWTLPVGATVVATAVWNRIPAELRPALTKAAQEAGARIGEDARRNRDASVAAMMVAGLTVVPVDDMARASWLRLADAMRAKMRGATVPADAFDEALKLRDEYRARKRGGAERADRARSCLPSLRRDPPGPS